MSDRDRLLSAPRMAHDTLFVISPYRNLRFCTNAADGRGDTIYQLSSTSAAGFFSRAPRVHLTYVDTALTRKTTAVLTLIANRPDFARYTGSIDDNVDGWVRHYDLRVRVDMEPCMRRRQIDAVVELRVSNRPAGLLNKFFALPTYDWDDYYIYTE